MKLKTKIYITQIVFAVTLLAFEIVTFENYKTQYQKDLQQYVEDKASLYKEEFLNSYYQAYKHLETKKKLFENVHKKALEILQKEDKELTALAKELQKEFYLHEIEVNLFVIDKNYVIQKTTFKQDLGLDLSKIAIAKKFLDAAKRDNRVHVSDFISTDAVNIDYKLYSYSRLDTHRFLELGFVDRGLYNGFQTLVKNFLQNKNEAIYVLSKYDDYYSYYSFVTQKEAQKKDLSKIQKKVPFEKSYSDAVVQAYLSEESFIYYHDDKAVIYKPLFEKSMQKQLGFENIILKIEVDISQKQQAMESYKQIFYLSIAFTFLLLLAAHFFIRKYFTSPVGIIAEAINSFEKITSADILSKNDEFSLIAKRYNNLLQTLEKELQVNRELLAQNKQFIADTVHQIRTPLTNIMMNAEMIERSSKDAKMTPYIEQINASISMLNNSYEDLSYVLTYDTLEYVPTSVNISEIVHERILFFTTISKIHFKKITYHIEPDIVYNINKIELERLIDNNIANGIKYATPHTEIDVALYVENDETVLEFTTHGKPIKNPQKIFEKNYREDDVKRGLGLGLYMVATIAKKYGIRYSIVSNGGESIFRYIFERK